MDIERLLRRAASHGVSFVPGARDRLTVRAPAPPPKRLRNQLKKYKAEILARLRVRQTGPPPHIDAAGVLVIPFDCPEKYHWWNGGQTVLETLTELGASDETMTRYKGPNWTR
jgi:hypothetical protein